MHSEERRFVLGVRIVPQPSGKWNNPPLRCWADTAGDGSRSASYDAELGLEG